ncbi:hypothetical protein H5410_003213, partial [Solanum commersonii]
VYLQIGPYRPKVHEFPQSIFLKHCVISILNGLKNMINYNENVDANNIHNQEKRYCDDQIQQQSICVAFDKQSDQIKHEYWTHLNASIDVVRLVLNPIYRCGKVKSFVVENALRNNKTTSPDIPKNYDNIII